MQLDDNGEREREMGREEGINQYLKSTTHVKWEAEQDSISIQRASFTSSETQGNLQPTSQEHYPRLVGPRRCSSFTPDFHTCQTEVGRSSSITPDEMR